MVRMLVMRGGFPCCCCETREFDCAARSAGCGIGYMRRVDNHCSNAERGSFAIAGPFTVVEVDGQPLRRAGIDSPNSFKPPPHKLVLNSSKLQDDGTPDICFPVLAPRPGRHLQLLLLVPSARPCGVLAIHPAEGARSAV
jgi:hypothetical protein